MGQFPSLPLFTDAFIADTGHLNAQQTGAYLMLLMVAWRSPGCTLPDDDAKLARWARVDPRTWAKIRPVIAEFWTIADGVWSQKRLTKERVHVSKRAEAARENGTRGGRPKSLPENKLDNPPGSLRDSKPKAPNPNPIHPTGGDARKDARPTDRPTEVKAEPIRPVTPTLNDDQLRAKLLACLPADKDWPIRLALDMRPIREAMAAGADLDRHVMPVVEAEGRSAAAGGRRLFRWANVSPQILAAVEREKRPAPSAAPAQSAFLAKLSPAQWVDYVRHWRTTCGDWPLARHTPAPDHPDTKVPVAILIAEGIRPAGTVTPFPDANTKAAA